MTEPELPTEPTSDMTLIKLIKNGPPWPIRFVGGVILAYDVWSWIEELVPTTTWEVVKHGLILLIATTLLYPEGAVLIMNVLRRSIPFLDRRNGSRK